MPTDLTAIVKLEVPLIVRVGEKRLTMDDVLALAPGAIVELDKSSEEELTLLVNNKPIGSGEAVKVGENFGLRITRIGSPAERVRALGATEPPAEDEAEEAADPADAAEPAEQPASE